MSNDEIDGREVEGTGEPEKNCECVMGIEYDTYPKIYKVAFRVYGVDSTGMNHLAVEVDRAYVVGLDVEDIIDQIKKDHINSEFNDHDGAEMHHMVGHRVVMHSVRCMGVLSYITTNAKKIFEIAEDDEDLI